MKYLRRDAAEWTLLMLTDPQALVSHKVVVGGAVIAKTLSNRLLKFDAAVLV
jgi:hypothetical protein